MTNAELKRAAATDLPAALDERSEELLDAPADDLLELAVAAGEMVETSSSRRSARWGDDSQTR
jgi:hypothetical protein